MIWIDYYRAYADPGHVPEWDAGTDRPPWPSTKHQLQVDGDFAKYLRARLDQLHERVHAEVSDMVNSAFPEEVWGPLSEDMGAATQSARAQTAERLEEYRARKRKPDATVGDLYAEWARKHVEATTGVKRRGPNKAISSLRDRLPAAKAADDMWAIRKVLFPRFWPEKGPGWRLPQVSNKTKADQIMAIAKIVQIRHPGCTSAKAFSWYENNGLAGI